MAPPSFDRTNRKMNAKQEQFFALTSPPRRQPPPPPQQTQESTRHRSHGRMNPMEKRMAPENEIGQLSLSEIPKSVSIKNIQI